MSYEKNIQGIRITGDISVNSISANTYHNLSSDIYVTGGTHTTGTTTFTNSSGGTFNVTGYPIIITKKLVTSSTTTIYSDSNILLEFQSAATDDIALQILNDPTSEKVHVLVSDVGVSLTAYDMVVADGKLDIDTDFGNDDKLDITIFAPSDSNYQAYRITLIKSNSLIYTSTPMLAIIELLPSYS